MIEVKKEERAMHCIALQIGTDSVIRHKAQLNSSVLKH